MWFPVPSSAGLFMWIAMHTLLLEGVLHVICKHYVIYVYCPLVSDESQ